MLSSQVMQEHTNKLKRYLEHTAENGKRLKQNVTSAVHLPPLNMEEIQKLVALPSDHPRKIELKEALRYHMEHYEIISEFLDLECPAPLTYVIEPPFLKSSGYEKSFEDLQRETSTEVETEMVYQQKYYSMYVEEQLNCAKKKDIELSPEDEEELAQYFENIRYIDEMTKEQLGAHQVHVRQINQFQNYVENDKLLYDTCRLLLQLLNKK